MQPSHQQFETKLRSTFERVKKLIPLVPENNWKESDKNTQLNFINYKRDDKEAGVPATRGEGLLNVNIKKLLSSLQDLDSVKKMESKLKSAQYLAKTHSGYNICYSVSNTPVGDDREILSIQGVFEEGGIVYFLVTSIEDDNLQAVQKGNTRMEHHYLAYALTPKGENQTHVVYISCADPKGMIPDFIKSKMNNSRGIEKLKTLSQFLV